MSDCVFYVHTATEQPLESSRRNSQEGKGWTRVSASLPGLASGDAWAGAPEQGSLPCQCFSFLL